jgi:pimeloyl-ACP methyl ester carboxylesterase
MLAASGELGALDQMFMPLMAGPGVTEATHGWFAGFAESFRTTDPLAFAVGLGAIAGLDHLGPLGALDLPVLVVHGSEDHMVPLEHGRAIAAAVPGAELAVLEGVGHLANLEAPDRFDGALVPFVERCQYK